MSKLNGNDPLTPFQRQLWDALGFRRWYDVPGDQDTGGFKLPEWFHDAQGQPMVTIRPMIDIGALAHRGKPWEPGGIELPQIRKCRAKEFMP